MDKVCYQDLYQFQFLSNLVLSPDGNHALFTRTRASKEKNGYLSELWILDVATGAQRMLTNGGKERGGFWLDDETVAFAGNREEASEPGARISRWYRISIHGGEAEKWLEIPERAGDLKPLGENQYLFTAGKKADGEAEPRPNAAQEGKDFYVFDELPFWFNGMGVANKQRSVLMRYDAQKHECTALTPPYRSVGGYQLSPGRKCAAYTGTEYTDVMPMSNGLYLYDVDSGETRTLVPQGEMGIGSIYFMGEDTLFFTGSVYRFAGQNPKYYLCDLPSGRITELPFCDAGTSGAVGTDCTYGGGNQMKYVDGKLYFTQPVWGNTQLVCMDRAGTIETVCATPGSITGFDISGDMVLMTAMRGMGLVEIWSLDLRTGEETQRTHFNTDYTKQHSVITPDYFTFTAPGGHELEGWVLKPADYQPGRAYPGIFEMHGGPKAIFGGIFHHEMQCFANMGYFVFYTNPRGSDGRGEAFANITENLGYIDFDDFMAFYDEVLKRYPDINAEKVGICGGSYGGFMCNWMIGHTDRFAAAASQRSISNYLTKALCTDIGFSHNMKQLGTDPWTDFDTVWEHSPLKNAPKAVTPTLFIQSDEDYRCWMSDAIQMFTALKQNGVDSRIALFHGENHELSRSGRPENRISRLKEIGDWFEKYLK